MTLALHGKSRTRVAALVVLATLSVAAAALLSISPGRPASVLAAPVSVAASSSIPAGASGPADSFGPEITATSGSTAEVVTLTFANPVPLGGTLTGASVVIRGDETNANVSTDIRRTSTITQLLTDADASWDANAGFESKSHSGPVLFDYLATRVDQATWSLTIGVLCTSSCGNGSAIVLDAVTLVLDFTAPAPITGTLTVRQLEWSPATSAYLESDNTDPSWLFDLSGGPTAKTGFAPGASHEALPGAYTVTARSTAGWFYVGHGVQANAPSGFQCPAGPAPPGASLPGGAAIVPVPIAAGQSTVVCVYSAPLAALEVTKLHDVTGDGISLDDEPLPGWRLAIYRDAAIVEAATGGEGSYAFTGLLPGAYIVCEESRPGWEATHPPAGSRVPDPAPSQGEPGRVCVDANLASGVTGTVTFANRELVAEPGTLVIEKYCDLDASGTRDPVEPACGGALFDVYGPDGELAAEADAGGALALPAGAYSVCEHPSPGTLNTEPGAAGAPDPAASGRPCRLASVEAGARTTVAFGNYAIRPLVVDGEGAGSYAESIAWSVSKQLADGEAPVVTVPSGGSHFFRFDIDVTGAVAYTTIVATGAVTVTNPNPVASGLTALVHAPLVNLPGAAVDGCTVAGNPVTTFPATIPAGASLACNWSLASPDATVAPSSLLVTPALTADPQGEVPPPPAVAPFAVGYVAAPPVGPPAVSATDVLLAAGVEIASLPLGPVDASRHFDGVTITVRCADATQTEFADPATGLQALHRANVARLSSLSGEAVAESAPVAVTLRCQQPRLALLKQLTGVPPAVETVLPSAWTLRARSDDAAIDLAGASGVSAFVPTGAGLLLDESGGDARFQPGSIVCTGLSGDVLHSAAGPPTTFAMPSVDTTCTFTNTYRPASLTVTVRALPAWSRPFAFSVDGPQPFAFELDDDGDDANARPRTWSEGDLAPGAYTVEVSSDSAGVWRLAAPVACTSDGIPFDPAARPGGVDLELHPGEDVVCTFEFRATATIQLCKAIHLRGEEVDGATLPGHRGPTTFTIPFDGAPGPVAFAIGPDAPLDPSCASDEVAAGTAYHSSPGPGVTAASVTLLDLPAGDYTVREPAGGPGCLIPTSLSFETRALAAMTPPAFAALAAAPVLGSESLAVTLAPGAIVHAAFANRACAAVLAAPNLWVRVFESSSGAYVAGATLPGYTVSLVGESGDAAGFSATLPSGSDGVAPFGAVPPGIYTVCEAPQTTHAVVGSLVGGARRPGPCRDGVEVLTGDTLVDFFNRPLTQPTASPSPSPSATTTAEPGFPADADATATPSPTPTLGPSLFPPTPTAPASQPSQPLSTRPTLTPSPIDTVAGDRTPGAGALATPIPPSTGTGPARSSTAPTTLLALAGLATIAVGLAALRAGRGK